MGSQFWAKNYTIFSNFKSGLWKNGEFFPWEWFGAFRRPQSARYNFFQFFAWAEFAYAKFQARLQAWGSNPGSF